jgi:hypothetical protein
MHIEKIVYITILINKIFRLLACLIGVQIKKKALTNDLKDKYLLSKLFFRQKKTIFIIFW